MLYLCRTFKYNRLYLKNNTLQHMREVSMKQIKRIELVLENCEIIDITGAIGVFYMDGLSTKIKRMFINSVSKYNCVETVGIQLYRNGAFDGLLFDEIDPIERLKNFKDITSIDITYDDDSQESYFVDYDEGSAEGMLGAENINQQFAELTNSVFILISAKEKIDESLLNSLSDDEEFLLSESVVAKYHLRKRGWKELLNHESLYQIYDEKEKLDISLDREHVKLIKLDTPFRITDFKTEIFSELLSHIFYAHSLKTTQDEEPKHIADMVIETYKTREKELKRKIFKLDQHDIVIYYDEIPDNVDKGSVHIDGRYIVSIEDCISLMWILFDLK